MFSRRGGDPSGFARSRQYITHLSRSVSASDGNDADTCLERFCGHYLQKGSFTFEYGLRAIKYE